MSSRQRNMLEAFKHAGEALPAGSPSAGGPFAGPRKVEGDKGPPPPIEVDTEVPTATWEQVLSELPPWLPKVLVLVAVFALGLVVGRATGGGGSVDAATPAGTARAGTGDGVDSGTGTTPPGEPGRILPGDPEIKYPEANPLYAPENQYTVVLITYENSEAGRTQAWDTYDWLDELAYPVFPPAYHVSDERDVIILAGAAETSAELDDLLHKIKQQPGKGRDTRPFESAYVARIDKQISRFR